MKFRSFKLVALLLVLLLLTSSFAFAAPVNVMVAAPAKMPEVKNVIIMIPDGTSVDVMGLARWYKGYVQEKGYSLAIDEIASGQVRTYWAAGPITDSAPSATSYATGKKSTSGYIGVLAKEVTVPGVDPLGPNDSQRPYVTTMEAAKQIGKSTGLVVTCNIQHATPASFSSHYPDRNPYQVLGEQQVYENLDVVLGGGSDYLTANKRDDKEDLLKVIKDKGYNYVTTRAGMQAVKSGKLWGMFAGDALAYDFDRQAADINDPVKLQPSVAEMTKKALDILSQDKDGFMLMVEGSMIDWGAHANDPVGIISEALAFDDAVKVALDFAKKDQNTMILIASDHGNSGVSMGNLATNGSYEVDTVAKFLDPLKKCKLTGAGVALKLNATRSNIVDVMSKYCGINDLTAQEINDIKVSTNVQLTVGTIVAKRANIGFTTTGHTGEEVMLYSYLPGNGRITGVIDNIDIGKLTAQVFDVDLDALTDENFVELDKYLVSRGFLTTYDSVEPASGNKLWHSVTYEAERGLQSLVIKQDKNIITINGVDVTTALPAVIYAGTYDKSKKTWGERTSDKRAYGPQMILDTLAPVGDTDIATLIAAVGGSSDVNTEDHTLTFTIGTTTGTLYVDSDVADVNGELVTLPGDVKDGVATDAVVQLVDGKVIVSQSAADFIMSLK